MSRENALAALIHDEIGQTLSRVFAKEANANPLEIAPRDSETLVGQLTAPGDGPPKVTLSFGLDIVQSSIATLLDALPTPDLKHLQPLKPPDVLELLNTVRGAIKGRLRFFVDRQEDVIARLIAARDPAALQQVADDLFQGVVEDVRKSSESARESVNRVRALLGNEAGGILPFATIVGARRRALENIAGVPESVEGALLDYFFKSAGYQTIDGESVVAPVHLSDIRGAVAGAGVDTDLARRQLRGLFSKATAERYLRDATRIVVESAFDAASGTNARYDAVTSGLCKERTKEEQDRIVKKFVAWLRGFSSMAESAAMRAVEVGTQGVSEFQTNPLIAAAAGSFAGTAARKLAQDCFLRLLETELRRPN
jgi:hypothetical protein